MLKLRPILLTLGLLLVLLQGVQAVPEVRATSLATEFVDSTDYLDFSMGGANAPLGHTITITGPSGASGRLVKTSQDTTPTTCRWYFGLVPSAPPSCPGSIEENGGWSVIGDPISLAVVPADGTWTLDFSFGYFARDDNIGTSSSPGPTLSIQSKAIHFGVTGTVATTLHQAWNWHQTTGTWDEPSTVPDFTAPETDPIDEGPEEDPEFARYFSDAGEEPTCVEQDLDSVPSGPPTPVDEDGDDVPGSYTYPTTDRHLEADCTITESPGDTETVDGPDPDDNDPGNPGASCTESDTYTPSGDAPTPTDADGDGFPGSYTYTEDRRHLNSDCSFTVTPDARTQTVDGPDPDDNDPNTPQGDEFNAFTLHYGAVSGCPTPTTITVNLAWAQGEGTTFSQFIYRDGDFTGQEDLRSILGFATTTEENEGDPATDGGTDTKTIPYNNAAGTTYQAKARTVAQGERLGAALWIPNGLCVITNPTIALAEIHEPDLFDLDASQAQCDDDLVSFTIDVDIGSVLTTVTDLDLYILDAVTGTTILQIDDAQMGFIGNRVWWTAEVFSTGAYLAIAKIDLGGVGAFDAYDSHSFNVPAGSCIDTEGDDSPLFIAIQNLGDDLTIHDANQTDFHNNETAFLEHLNWHVHNINATIIGNITVNGTSLLSLIYNNTNTLVNGSLLVNNMAFDGLEFDGWAMVWLWLIALVWCLKNGKLLAAATCAIGIACVLIPGPEWIQWVGILAFVIALFLEAFAMERIYQRFFHGENNKNRNQTDT